jgi:hypothetical protein
VQQPFQQPDLKTSPTDPSQTGIPGHTQRDTTNPLRRRCCFDGLGTYSGRIHRRPRSGPWTLPASTSPRRLHHRLQHRRGSRGDGTGQPRRIGDMLSTPKPLRDIRSRRPAPGKRERKCFTHSPDCTSAASESGRGRPHRPFSISTITAATGSPTPQSQRRRRQLTHESPLSRRQRRSVGQVCPAGGSPYGQEHGAGRHGARSRTSTPNWAAATRSSTTPSC